jgi:hypothetical protein
MLQCEATMSINSTLFLSAEAEVGTTGADHLGFGLANIYMVTIRFWCLQ